jgi:hypothetical protein
MDCEDQVRGELFFFLNDLEGVFGEGLQAGRAPAPDDIEAECHAWLTALPEAPRLIKKDALERFNRLRRKANRKIIGERTFLRAWREAAPQSWREPGRRPST